MIKLVVSDIDGTLIQEGTNQMDPGIYDVVRELKAKGILFAAASGRQYESMLHVFRPVAEDMIFIAENGSNVMCRGKNMAGDFLDPDQAEALLYALRKIPGGEIMLSTPESIYLETENEEFANWLVHGYKNKVTRVPDLLPYCRNSNKMSLYHKEQIQQLMPRLQEQFGSRMNVMVSGSVWVDFMSLTADKGNALAQIQELLHISPEETMAFGDNCNDIGMLGRAAYSYAVANAHPQLLEAANYIAPSNLEHGVVRTIRSQLLQE